MGKKVKKEEHSDDDAYKKEYDEKIENIVKIEACSDWDEAPKKKTPKKTSSSERKSTAKNGSASAKKAKKVKTEVKREAEESPKKSPKKRVKKEEPPEKEKREASGIKWTSLEHKGPLFPPEYTPLPKGVYMTYKGNKVKLEPEAEEVMTFYASMINTDYVTDANKSKLFNKNFFKDWRESMTDKERELITKLEHCDFSKVKEYQEEQREIRKNRPK